MAYSMNDIVLRLQCWYAHQCNGTWEHARGITIETLDNPGWKVEIDLAGTKWENLAWKELKVERADDDWINCSKQNGIFQGYGDSSKLVAILNDFLEQVKT